MKMLLQFQDDSFLPVRDEDVANAKTLKADSSYLVTLKKASKNELRSIEQNRMQYQWYNDLETQGDMTAQEYRAYCKLHFGVPILRANNEDFREKYDRIVKPLPYDSKLALMLEPIALPVTSEMDTKTMTQYLDAMSKHWMLEGFTLTGFEQLIEWSKEA